MKAIPPEELQAIIANFEAQLAKKDAIIEKLKEENLKLKEENERLAKKLRKFINPNTPSSSIPPYLKDELKSVIDVANTATTQQRYTQPKDNKRNARTKEPDRKEYHPAESCPFCGGKLKKKKHNVKRMVISLPLPTAEYVLHECERGWCANCKKEIVANVPDALPNSKYSLSLSAFVVFLSVAFHMSEAKIAEFLQRFRVDISPSSVGNVIRRVSRYLGDKKYNELKEELKKAVATYSDETGARHRGRLNWAWLSSNAKTTFISIQNGRQHSVARKLPIGQVSVNDGYRAYDGAAKSIQRCWAHALRQLRQPEHYFASEEDVEQYKEFANGIFDIYRRAKAMKRRGRIIQKQFDEELRAFLLKPRRFERNLEAVRDYLLRYDGEWFTFLKRWGVEPTNNRAERALRHFVIKRKISQHTWSDEGKHALEKYLSLYETCRLRKEDFMDLLMNEINRNLHEMEKS